MIYVTLEFTRACRELANLEWARSVERQSGPRNSRLVRMARATVRRVGAAQPPVLLGVRA